MNDGNGPDLSRLNVKDDGERPNPPMSADVPLTAEGKIEPAGGKAGAKTELAKKYRSSAYKGNARGLGKHDKDVQDNFTMLQGFEWYNDGTFQARGGGARSRLGDAGDCFIRC